MSRALARRDERRAEQRRKRDGWTRRCFAARSCFVCPRASLYVNIVIPCLVGRYWRGGDSGGILSALTGGVHACRCLYNKSRPCWPQGSMGWQLVLMIFSPNTG